MIALSNVFQQYTQEYISSEPGSEKEESFFSKIESTYARTLQLDSSLINSYYISAFIEELKKRGNADHLERFETILCGTEEIKDNCTAIAYFKTKENDICSMRDDIKKLRTAFPVHVSKPIGTSSQINPFEEFELLSIDKYFDNYASNKMTCQVFGEMDVDARIKLLSKEFAKYTDISFEKVFSEVEQQDEISVVRTVDGKKDEILIIATSPSIFVVQDSSNGEARTTIHVDFRKNPCFDYLFDPESTPRSDSDPEASVSGQVYMINDVPGTQCQVCLLFCLLEGFINFSDYKRYHKKTSIVMNGIAKYIESKFTFGGITRLTFGYDYAYLVYSQNEKFDKQTTKSARISYDSYVDEIDNFIKELA